MVGVNVCNKLWDQMDKHVRETVFVNAYIYGHLFGWMIFSASYVSKRVKKIEFPTLLTNVSLRILVEVVSII